MPQPPRPHPEAAPVSPWGDIPDDPSSFLLVWNHEEPPLAESALRALEGAVGSGFQVSSDECPDDGSALWQLQVSFPRHADGPANLWCEPRGQHRLDGLAPELAGACRWILSLETLLALEHVPESYTGILRWLLVAFPEVTAIRDLHTGRWHTRQSLGDLVLGHDLTLPAQQMWVIHAVHDEGRVVPGVWLHTHGLWRCGALELDALAVPRAQAGACGELINAIGELFLESAPTEPGVAATVGEGIHVALVPWERAARLLPAEASGSVAERRRIDWGMHSGARAAICEPDPGGAGEPAWSWPRSAVDRIRAPDAIFYRTEHATVRQAKLARLTWPELAMAYFSLHARRVPRAAEEPPAVLVKAGFDAAPNATTTREHMWIAVRRIEGERAEGELLNQPFHVPELKRGDVIWITTDQLSDWCVETPLGTFSPHQTEALREAVGTLRG